MTTKGNAETGATGNRSENRAPATYWNSVDWRKAEEEVRRLRQRIFRAEQSGNARKVRSLQKLMLRGYSNRLVAVRRVTQTNQGKNTPGVDRVLVKTPAERGRLVDSLAEYQPWKPAPVRRVCIPKANGKLRPLGIPTIRDRAIQAMVKNALEPQWEARFEGCSYGFRPGRSAQDAMVLIHSRANVRTHFACVIDADIRSAFDKISHEFLLAKIGNFPARELLKQWLKAGVVEEGGFFRKTEEGTPQGGVISPLLANIALDGMEAAIPADRLVRYADDFVIFCRSRQEAEEIMLIAARWLAGRGLEFSSEKTRIRSLTEGFDFLGFHVRRYYAPGTKRRIKGTLFPHPRDEYVTLTKPSRESERKFRRKVREKVKSLESAPQEVVIKALNPIVWGWGNYFRHEASKRSFTALTHYYAWVLLWKWARRRHPRKSRFWIKDRYWGSFNPRRNDNWEFGLRAGPNGKPLYLWKLYWIPIVRHEMVTGKFSPDDPSLVGYWAKRRNRKNESAIPSYQKTLSILQKGVCPHCRCGLDNGEDLHIHHIVPRSRGGADHILNMQLVHMFCHQQIHAKMKAGTA